MDLKFRIIRILGQIPGFYLLFIERILLKNLTKLNQNNFYAQISILNNKFQVDLREPIQQKAVFGRFERWETKAYSLLGQDEATVIDIGANVGLSTVPMWRSLKEGERNTLIAFEPIPANYDLLQKNLLLNFNLQIIPNSDCKVAIYQDGSNILKTFEYALSDSLETDLYLEKPEYHLGMKLPETSGFYSKSSRMRGIKVKTKNLDQIIKEHEEINFIKIDVEGMEREILESISDDSWSKINLAQVECHLGLFNISDAKVIEIFKRRNYKSGILMLRVFGKIHVIFSIKTLSIAFAPMHIILKILGKKGNTVVNVYFQKRIPCK